MGPSRRTFDRIYGVKPGRDAPKQCRRLPLGRERHVSDIGLGLHPAGFCSRARRQCGKRLQVVGHFAAAAACTSARGDCPLVGLFGPVGLGHDEVQALDGTTELVRVHAGVALRGVQVLVSQ